MKEKARNVMMLVLSTMLGAVGQFFFKYAFLHSAAFAVLLGIGILSYVVSTFVYFCVLSRVHLSFAYSMGGMSYIFAVLLAVLLLGEQVPLLRWTGVLAIAAGVVLVGLS